MQITMDPTGDIYNCLVSTYYQEIAPMLQVLKDKYPDEIVRVFIRENFYNIRRMIDEFDLTVRIIDLMGPENGNFIKANPRTLENTLSSHEFIESLCSLV